MAKQLLVIAGPTASGKSSLALQIAQRYNGIIVCADSRSVYKGMDIGTAKPTAEDQQLVPHIGLDLVAPDQPYSVADFQAMAVKAIASAQLQGQLPILVGGSGLYVDSVVFQYDFNAENTDNALRTKLSNFSLAELNAHAASLGIDLTGVDTANPRRVIRAIERAGKTPKKAVTLPRELLYIVLNPPDHKLYTQIVHRNELMLKTGLIEETESIAERYGSSIEPLNTVPYKQALQYLEGAISEEKLEELLNTKTRQLAKRQRTWLRRNPEARWFESSNDAISAIDEWLGAQKRL